MKNSNVAALAREGASPLNPFINEPLPYEENPITHRKERTHRGIREKNNNTHTGSIYIAYTDGSSDNKHPSRPSGAAYIMLDDKGKVVHKAAKGFVGKTNNYCEMIAIISAVNWIPEGASVIVFSDSQYAIKVFNGEWHPKKNVNLITMYHSIRKGKTVSLRWVKGHNGNKWNEECDRMANAEYMKMKELFDNILV